MTRFTADPYKELASSILYFAIIEWDNTINKVGADLTDMIDFFQSDWFECLCGLALVDPFVTRQKKGIPQPTKVNRWVFGGRCEDIMKEEEAEEEVEENIMGEMNNG